MTIKKEIQRLGASLPTINGKKHDGFFGVCFCNGYALLFPLFVKQ